MKKIRSLLSWVTLLTAFSVYSEPAAPMSHIPSIGVDTAGTYLQSRYRQVGWMFPAFESALDSLGAEFIMDHYMDIHTGGSYEQNYAKTVKDIQVLGDYLKKNGKEYIWNLEFANWRVSASYIPGQNLYEPEPGLHYLKIPRDLMAELQKIPEIRGVCYDEFEHMQLCNNKFMNPTSTGDKPAFADTTQLTLDQAYPLLVEKLKALKSYYDEYGKECSVENVWPVMQHIFARAGWTISPKVMKESWNPVPMAMTLGAAIEYEQTGCDVWLNPDFWFCGHYPGHSTEELRSSLLLGHWTGMSRVYVENLDYVRRVVPQGVDPFDYSKVQQGRHHPDAHGVWGSLVFFNSETEYTRTPYGDVMAWYTHDYKDSHPVPYTWRDARCKVAIIRFPDSCWGQRGTSFGDYLLGSKIEKSTPATEAWFSIWNQLSLGTIPTNGLSFHCKGVNRVYGPRFFCPMPPVLVFDHRVGNEHPDFDFRGAEVLFLTGVSITPETMGTVKQYVKKTGATAIMLRSLAPEGFKSSAHFFTVDSFDDPQVKKVLSPVLPPEDEMQFVFGDNQVNLKKIDRDRIRVFLNGKPVSPIIESNSQVSIGPDGRELMGWEDLNQK